MTSLSPRRPQADVPVGLWPDVKAILQGALDVPHVERDAFVARACGTNTVLRHEVDSLLAAALQPGSFLDAPAALQALALEEPGSDSAALMARLRSALGERYLLERELARGGMSRVFLAEERALSRPVVIKVLRPDLAFGVSAERFAREVRLTARLQQANIVPMLAAGDIDGLPWYTMPYVRGESLRVLLDAGDAISPGDACDILRDIAKALAYAHAEGVVHRDIKPENVLLSGRTAVVTDFGIAKAISAARGAPADAALTATGEPLTLAETSLGTPAYMAPEQIAGDRDVGAAADVYSFGILAYELLAGVHPFAGTATVRGLMVAHMSERPRPVGEVRPEVPMLVGALVMRCLAKDPAARPGDGAQLLAALVAAEQGEMPAGNRVHEAGSPAAFELYLRGRHLVERRVEGMHEALRCFEQAATLAPGFSPTHAGIAYVYTMFAIYHAMRPREAFPRARDAADRALAIDASDALALVMRAQVALWYEWDFDAAEARARRALELAPGLHIAHAGHGYVLAARGRFDEAIASLQRARELDPLSQYAIYDLSWVLILAGRWDQALLELRPAVERHPQASELRRALGFCLFYAGRLHEARAEFERALRLNDGDRWATQNLVQVLAALGEHEEARRLLAEVERRATHEPIALFGVAAMRHWLGDDDAAFEWLERAFDARDYWLVMLPHDPSFARLHGSPRFEAAVRRVHA